MKLSKQNLLFMNSDSWWLHLILGIVKLKQKKTVTSLWKFCLKFVGIQIPIYVNSYWDNPSFPWHKVRPWKFVYIYNRKRIHIFCFSLYFVRYYNSMHKKATFARKTTQGWDGMRSRAWQYCSYLHFYHFYTHQF